MKRLILQVAILLTISVVPALVASTPAYAACPSANDNSAKAKVIGGIKEANDNTCDDSGVTDIISGVVKILSIVVGAAAVIVIIYSGFKYITSAGDAAKVGGAKNTLIYALVGLAIAVLAQLIVNVVITQASDVGKPASSSSKKKP